MDEKDALSIVRKAFPRGRITKQVSYKELYLFQVFLDVPDEEGLDPFYSVNKITGELREFSILTDGDILELTELFVNAKEL